MATTCSLVLALLAPNATGTAAAGALIEPLLAQVLSSAGLTERIEAVVSFARRPTASDLAAVSRTGVRVVPLKVLPMAGIRGTRSQVGAVAALPNVVSLHYNRRLKYFMDESVPLIGANQVWANEGIVGRGSTIAVVDTGVDGLHPDLPYGAKVVQNVVVAEDPFGLLSLVIEGLATTDLTSSHGTHVASTVAGLGKSSGGRYTGVAPGADIVGISAGFLITVLNGLASWDWVLENQARYGIDIVSNSWGLGGSFDPADPVNKASKALHDAGMVVVFAAGNAGPGNNTLNPFSVAPWVIGVAAGNKDGKTLADFSSRGIPGHPLNHPTITAPGNQIVAARSLTGLLGLPVRPADLALGADALRYTTMSGTSMATPHVSGVAALMLEASPNLTPDQIKELLRSTATPMPGYGEHEVGAGYVDAGAAVAAARSAP